MAGRPRMRGNVKAKLSLEPESYGRHKKALKELERAVRKEIIERALKAGGTPIHDVAQAKAPGKIEMRIIGGRTLKKRVDAKFAFIVKSNAKLVAIGPSKKHWYYRFFEFGATKHDISVTDPGWIAFLDVVAPLARQTGGVRKQPFLRPAVDNNKDAAVRAMGSVLSKEIETAARA